jgi:hypothetical protein
MRPTGLPYGRMEPRALGTVTVEMVSPALVEVAVA